MKNSIAYIHTFVHVYKFEQTHICTWFVILMLINKDYIYIYIYTYIHICIYKCIHVNTHRVPSHRTCLPTHLRLYMHTHSHTTYLVRRPHRHHGNIRNWREWAAARNSRITTCTIVSTHAFTQTIKRWCKVKLPWTCALCQSNDTFEQLRKNKAWKSLVWLCARISLRGNMHNGPSIFGKENCVLKVALAPRSQWTRRCSGKWLTSSIFMVAHRSLSFCQEL